MEGNKKSSCDKIKLNKENFARGETLHVDVIAAARILAGIFCWNFLLCIFSWLKIVPIRKLVIDLAMIASGPW